MAQGRFQEKQIDEVVEEYYQRIQNAFEQIQSNFNGVKSGFQLLNTVKADVQADPELTDAEVSDIQAFADERIELILTFIVGNIDNAKLKTMLEDITGKTITIQ